MTAASTTSYRSQRPWLESLEERAVPSTVAASFDNGVWRWDSAAGWAYLSTQQASALAVDDSGNVYGQFADGVWRWDAGTFGWARLSDRTASGFDVTAGGVFYGSFSDGVWRWSFSGWMRLTDNLPDQFSVSDADAYYGSFTSGVDGTWRWSPTQGWNFISPNRPTQMRANDLGELYGTYDTSGGIAAGQEGTWRWNPSTGWARLSNEVPSQLYVSDAGITYEDRDVDGIWRVGPGQNSFTDTGIGDPGPGYALSNGNLFTKVGGGGGNSSGWLYNAQTGTYTKIIDDTSNLFLFYFGKDGDIFIDGDAAGLWHWSAATGYHQLSGGDPYFVASQS